jgi:zinc protease
MKQTKFQLKNKLNVLLIESKKSPVVSVQMWVKTGSADEKKSEEGISHFIEHLVFKGTEKYKVGEIANIVEASGGELNAYTSFDQTVFYVTISKSFTDVALDVVSQMMGFPTFDPAEVDSEREVVCEEIKMGQDSPRRRSSQMLFSSAYKKHAYGIPVIGYEKNVRSWPVKKIKSFYQSRYVPSNMFLVVSGDFETAEMKKKVQEFYGGFKNYKLRKVKRVKEPVQKKFQALASSYQQQDQHLHFVFKAPNVKNADVPALDVLTMILGQGDSSRLVKKLRLEKPIVSGVSAFNYNPQDEGLLAISAYFQGDSFDVITKECLQQIKNLQTQEVSWDEIKRSIVAISAEQFYSVETVDGIANKAGTQEFYFKDQAAQKKYLNKLNKVGPKDVMKVAKKYFKLEKLSASYMGSQPQAELKSKLDLIPRMWKDVFETKSPVQKLTNKKVKIPKLILAPKKSAGQLDVEKIQLDSGIQILFSPVKETPTVSAKLVLKGGARFEQPDVMGLSELTSRLWVSSTEKRSEAQLMQEIEESAIGLSSFSGKNTSGFSLDYLTVFEDKALDLLTDCILNTRFETEIIEREKEMLYQAIKSREDHPSSLCMRQFLKAIFGSHPLSFEATGTNESLQRITRQHLIDFKNKVLNAQNLTISVVGDFNKKSWLKKIEEIDKAMAHVKASAPIHNLEKLSQDKSEFLVSNKEQSHVVVGWRGLTINSPQRHTLEAIEAILAGQGGRLFYELRDKNSLAYSVSPIKMESLETGYFGGYIACSPEKVDKAIEMFRAEFNKLVQEKVSPEELDRAKRYLIGQHDIGLQKKAAICNLLAFDEVYGNDYKKSLNIAEEYQKITADQIQSLARELFSKPSVVSVVGQNK